jgi:hypothetical protein
MKKNEKDRKREKVCVCVCVCEDRQGRKGKKVCVVT